MRLYDECVSFIYHMAHTLLLSVYIDKNKKESVVGVKLWLIAREIRIELLISRSRHVYDPTKVNPEMAQVAE